jgi:DNA-binding transcriptional MocR family regulator
MMRNIDLNEAKEIYFRWIDFHDGICKITHTYQSCSQVVDLSRKSIVLTFGLFFTTRYAPDSGFFFTLTSENKRKIQRAWKHIPSKILLLEEGKQKEAQA